MQLATASMIEDLAHNGKGLIEKLVNKIDSHWLDQSDEEESSSDVFEDECAGGDFDIDFMLWWDEGKHVEPVFFNVKENGECHFVTGCPYNKKPEAHGKCTLDDLKEPLHPTMTFHTGKTQKFSKVDKIDKWHNENKSIYVWRTKKDDEEEEEVEWKPNTKPTPFLFYWTGYKKMHLPALPVWFWKGKDETTNKDWCKFVIGSQHSKDKKAWGTCDVADDFKSGELHWWNKKTSKLSATDDFKWGDFLEPEADAKWSDGSDVFVWLMNDHDKKRDKTPYMFWWDGMKELNLPPLPVWFDVKEDGCKFAMGDQFAHKKTSVGECTLDGNEVPEQVELMFGSGDKTTMKKVNTFDAGELEPNAINKWSNGKDLYIWQIPEKDMSEPLFYN